MSDYENSFLLWVTSGWCLNLFVMDESTRHDSSCITEILAQTLEMVNEIAMSRQVPMPGTVLICSDNTVRESKNQFVLRYLCNLLSKYHVRVTGLLNLRKSHTHDLLDQLWGILARRVASCDRFQSPASVIKILESELQRPGLGLDWTVHKNMRHETGKRQGMERTLWMPTSSFIRWSIGGCYRKSCIFADALPRPGV